MQDICNAAMHFQGGDLHNVQLWKRGQYLGYIDNHAGPHDHHPAQGSSADFGEVLLIILALEQKKSPKLSGHLWSGHLGILEDGILPGSTCSCLLWGLEVLESAVGGSIEIFLENTACRSNHLFSSSCNNHLCQTETALPPIFVEVFGCLYFYWVLEQCDYSM